MRSRLAVLAAALGSMFSLSAIGARPASGPAIDIRGLEARILEARRQVTSGEFRIAVTSSEPFNPRRSYHIWLDGRTNVRQEVQNDDQLHVYILNDKVAIYYGGRPGDYENPDLTKRFAVYMAPAAEAYPFMFCDPRVAMMVPLQVGLWPRYHPDSFVGDRDQANVAARLSVWNGLDSIVVSFENPRTGHTFEYEAVPARSYNIVRWHMAGTFPGRTAPGRFESTTECDLMEAKERLWLPHQIHRIEKWNGKTKTDETVILAPLGVNEAMEPSRFTLAGGHLPPKQLIIQSSPPWLEALRKVEGPTTAPSDRLMRRPLLWWDGKEVRPLTRADEAERVKSKSAAQSPAEW